MTTVSARSVRVNDLRMRTEIAMCSAAPRESNAPGDSVSKPGRTTTRVPRKPTMTALQRRILTTSPKTKAAPAVANRGAVKLKAVACANGISVKDQKPAVMPRMPMPERTK